MSLLGPNGQPLTKEKCPRCGKTQKIDAAGMGATEPDILCANCGYSYKEKEDDSDGR